jgi:hypothetical protein
MSGAVYVLCAATSFLCSAMLLRGYLKTHVNLLLWSALCFLGLAIDNSVLSVDRILMPDTDMTLWRRLPGFVALTLLLFGLVWDSK